MDAATLQSKIYYGYKQAAKRIGYLTSQYRPTSSTNPIVPANLLQSLNASFNAEDMTYQKPRGYGKAVWYCLVDGTQTRVGDYLVNAEDGTFFIAAQQTGLPILVVKCNANVRIGRMPPDNVAGDGGYSGDVRAQEVDVLGVSDNGAFVAGWPASILIGGRSDGGSTLPSGVKMAGVTILLPLSVPIQILESDIVQDDAGKTYAVYSTELTDLGWRMQANNEHT